MPAPEQEKRERNSSLFFELQSLFTDYQKRLEALSASSSSNSKDFNPPLHWGTLNGRFLLRSFGQLEIRRFFLLGMTNKGSFLSHLRIKGSGADGIYRRAPPVAVPFPVPIQHSFKSPLAMLQPAALRTALSLTQLRCNAPTSLFTFDLLDDFLLLVSLHPRVRSIHPS
ncbi:hypothetical protein QYF36_022471 [Acer negundo]|nr:hypothetical protein QYF36_010980 [Acer negundo]KAK4839511.1 hypothetical protein QYF36_022471 [Acer negundo]